MPAPTWDLALVELIFYIPTLLPTLYCLWQHRRRGLGAWIYLTAFVGLQIVGAALIISAGPTGTPSTASLIISSIGLSPLLIGIAGAMHEWITLSRRFQRQTKLISAIYLLFHVAVVGATVLYAEGASEAEGAKPGDGSTTLWKAGIVTIGLLWITLCVVLGALILVVGHASPRVLVWPIVLSLVLLGMRVIYQCVATFDYRDNALNPRDGNIAFRAVFDFLTGAFIILTMVVGGVASLGHLRKHGVECADLEMNGHTKHRVPSLR